MNTALDNILRMSFPAVWCNTEEPVRFLNELITQTDSDREIFRLDAIDGLLVFDRDKDRWLIVLIDQFNPMTGEMERKPTTDPAVSMDHVIKEQGVLVVEFAHLIAEKILGIISSLNHRYRRALYSDDCEDMPAQLFMLSHEDTAPPEISRNVITYTHSLPDSDEISELSELIAKSVDLEGVELSKVVRAAAGLSEVEFTTAALGIIRDEGQLSPARVSEYKMDMLRKSDILDVRSPVIDMDGLGGLDIAKDLVNSIAWLWQNEEQAAAMGVEPLRRLMLVGVPGTGKSMICEAIATALGVELAKGGVSNSLSKWVGESEQNMRRMFKTLKAMAPVVFWIDEFGRDMSGGGTANDGGTTDRVHGEFLTGIQELPNNIFLAAAANRIEDLSPEITRAERFDKVMFVGFPSFTERQEIFKIHLGKKFADMYDVEVLASATPFYTGAEIKALIKQVRFTVITKTQRQPTTEHFVRFAPRMKGRLWVNKRADIVKMYERAMNDWDWASTSQVADAPFVLESASKDIIHPALVDGSADASYVGTNRPTGMKKW